MYISNMRDEGHYSIVITKRYDSMVITGEDDSRFYLNEAVEQNGPQVIDHS